MRGQEDNDRAQIKINDNHELITFDIKYLYVNIPVKFIYYGRKT
jgi:hypothetical protein